MHSLQELHQGKLQTFGATFICSVLGKERKGKERKGKQRIIIFYLRPGLMSEWPVFKKLCILLHACLPLSSAHHRREQVINVHNTDM